MKLRKLITIGALAGAMYSCAGPWNVSRAQQAPTPEAFTTVTLILSSDMTTGSIALAGNAYPSTRQPRDWNCAVTCTELPYANDQQDRALSCTFDKARPSCEDARKGHPFYQSHLVVALQHYHDGRYNDTQLGVVDQDGDLSFFPVYYGGLLNQLADGSWSGNGYVAINQRF
jgi:hypothetical protein